MATVQPPTTAVTPAAITSVQPGGGLCMSLELAWGQVFFFFRDPHRQIPTDPDVLVSPADGTITDIGEVAETEFPGGRAFRIGMFLSVLNVHVNRMPRTVKVIGLRYFPGSFLDA